MNGLKELYADPRPGDLIITKGNQLGIIDFGCIKEIPLDFYEQYLQLMRHDILDNGLFLN